MTGRKEFPADPFDLLRSIPEPPPPSPADLAYVWARFQETVLEEEHRRSRWKVPKWIAAEIGLYLRQPVRTVRRGGGQ